MKLATCVSFGVGVGVGVVTLILTACTSAPTGPSQSNSQTSGSQATVLSISIEPDNASLQVGQRVQFSVAVALTDGVPPSGPLPHWSSSNPSVATVDDNGVVTAISGGGSLLQVDFRGKTATRRLEVLLPGL